MLPCLFGPATVGCGASGARVENLTDLERRSWQCGFGSLSGEGPDADEPIGFEDLDDLLEVMIAVRFQLTGDGRRQFVRRKVTSGRFQEREGAVVGHEMFGKEFFRLFESVLEESPETFAAHFGSLALEPFDGTFGMFRVGSLDAGRNFHPIPDKLDLTERHGGLHHAEGAGIHSQEDDSFFGFCKAG